MQIYANLLGTWTDITDTGTVADHQNPVTYFSENLTFNESEHLPECFRYNYIHVQYQGHDYRLHPSMIQIVDYN